MSPVCMLQQISNKVLINQMLLSEMHFMNVSKILIQHASFVLELQYQHYLYA